MNALATIDTQANVDAYRASTNAADLCKGIVVASAMEIQGRKYVKVEGWQAIAIAHGCTGSARDVERVDGGIRAIGEVRRMSDGQIIAEAEGFVGEDEPTWFGGEVTTKYGTKVLPKRADYAIRAMAQTRAISRACRSAFAHVVVMMNAGLSTTPAEEVPLGGFNDEPPRTETVRDVTPGSSAPTHTGKTINTQLDAFIAAMKMNKTVEKVDAWASREANNIMEKLNKRDQDLMQSAYEAYRKLLSAVPQETDKPSQSTSLNQRALLLESALKDCTDAGQLERVWTRGGQVLDELDRSDPERRAELDALYGGLTVTLPAMENA